MVKHVSLIVPCRNEEQFIGKCLDSIIQSTYPKDSLEVFVVDGMSEDKTRQVVEEYTRSHFYIQLLNNPRKIIPSAMNIGIMKSRGSIIMKIDAHAVYQNDYIEKCVRHLNERNADNVGGTIIAIPRENTLMGHAIVQVLSHPFGVGNSYFRTGCKEPLWADTAFSGCYRRDVFDRVGMYDENIARSEDVAINSKLIRGGGKVLLVPEIVSYYYARSRITDFCRHNFDNGFWVIHPLRFGRMLFSWRHMIPLVFVSVLLLSAGMWAATNAFQVAGVLDFMSFSVLVVTVVAYLVMNVYFSAGVALREKNLRYIFLLPVLFISLHIGYGSGSLWGLIRFIFRK